MFKQIRCLTEQRDTILLKKIVVGSEDSMSLFMSVEFQLFRRFWMLLLLCACIDPNLGNKSLCLLDVYTVKVPKGFLGVKKRSSVVEWELLMC